MAKKKKTTPGGPNQRIKQRDKALADQLSGAASSISLNLGEAEFSDPGNRRARAHHDRGAWSRRALDRGVVRHR